MSSVYRIGDLVLDAGRQELTRDGERIHLGPLSYRFLLALVETAPDVASHEALAAAVWRGRVVSPETISQRGKLLREALGDDPHHPRYVEVLRGRGYRLVPPVVPLPAQARAARPRRAVIALAASLGLGIAAVLGLLATRQPEPVPTPSIAVLPFADMSPGHDQEYFADGMAEEILNLLSSTTSLKVTARTSSFSFRDQSVDIPTIAEKLNVAYLLEGSVRRSEDRVRVTVQLVAGADGTHVWSESYDRELRDVLQLQSEIAASVAAALDVKLVGDGTAELPARSPDPEAFDAYLRGRQQMQNLEALEEAERHFERAIEIDPTFIHAYSGLGLVYTLQIMDLHKPLAENTGKLREIVQQGLAIAPDHPGLIGLSGQLARYEGKMDVAEQRLRRAFELDPADVTIVINYATFKLDQGHAQEALQIAQRLLERDPLNPFLYLTIMACQIDLGNETGVVAAAKRHNEVGAERLGIGFIFLGHARTFMSGDFVGGISHTAQGYDIITGGATKSYGLPPMYYEVGDLETGDAALAAFNEAFDQETPPFVRMYRHLVSGEVDKAREMAMALFTGGKLYSAAFADIRIAYLATDALIARGEAGRVIEIIERLAPVYAAYRSTPEIPAREFFPAPYMVKGTWSSYPALYFPIYIRALRAAGDADGARNMLNHLEAILELRRQRGLLTGKLHVAEARVLRADLEGALDALEEAEREGTIYLGWHVFLLHNEIFADLRRHPRYQALVARVEAEMARQRAELARTMQARH